MAPNDIIDTYTVPEDVDPVIAQERNQLIEDWRAGDAEDQIVLAGIARLYWANQDTASDQTRHWLVDTKIDFAVEAGIDSDTAFDIWEKVQEEIEE